VHEFLARQRSTSCSQASIDGVLTGRSFPRKGLAVATEAPQLMGDMQHENRELFRRLFQLPSSINTYLKILLRSYSQLSSSHGYRRPILLAFDFLLKKLALKSQSEWISSKRLRRLL
jgi:hypothetical protein